MDSLQPFLFYQNAWVLLIDLWSGENHAYFLHCICLWSFSWNITELVRYRQILMRSVFQRLGADIRKLEISARRTGHLSDGKWAEPCSNTIILFYTVSSNLIRVGAVPAQKRKWNWKEKNLSDDRLTLNSRQYTFLLYCLSVIIEFLSFRLFVCFPIV